MIRLRAARATALAAVVAALLAASPVRAETTIVGPSCADLDLAQVHRLLEVELAEVASQWAESSPPVVLLGCAGERVRIEITDPVTDKSVARTIVRPAADRERVVALAIAQLFVTSWLELLIDEPAENVAWAEAAERVARDAVAEARGEGRGGESETETASETETETGAEVETEAEPERGGGEPDAGAERAARARVDAEVSLEGGTRVRLEGERLATAAAALRGALVLDDSILAALRVGTEYARTSRVRGDVDVYTATFGIGAAWRAPRVGPVSLDAGVWVSGIWLALEGRPASPDVQGGATIAIAAEASLELAPSLVVGPVIVSVPLGFGLVAFAPEGEVSGEAPVIVGGPFFDAALRIAIVPSHF